VNVVIFGCGRVGARLANALSKSHQVTIIDQNPPAFERLAPDFRGEAYTGNGIDIDVLRMVGVAQADAFIAVTNGDNRNLMAAQIARHLGAAFVIARVYDAERCEIFAARDLHTLSPTVRSSRRLLNMVLDTGEGV
jgi:trk system potassium uptake protein TrkA